MERPIILKAHEVRGIIDGRQTQLRRIIKPQPSSHVNGNAAHPQVIALVEAATRQFMRSTPCPFGQVGDRLWGRETWTDNGGRSSLMYRADLPLFIPADQTEFGADVQMNPEDYKWTSSAQMNRWASRIRLEIVSVRVERIQDISEPDALDSGIWYEQNLGYTHNGEEGSTHYPSTLSQSGGTKTTAMEAGRRPMGLGG